MCIVESHPLYSIFNLVPSLPLSSNFLYSVKRRRHFLEFFFVELSLFFLGKFIGRLWLPYITFHCVCCVSPVRVKPPIKCLQLIFFPNYIPWFKFMLDLFIDSVVISIQILVHVVL